MKIRHPIFFYPDTGASFVSGAAAALRAVQATEVIDPPEKKEETPPADKKEMPPAANTDDLPENLPNEGRGEAWKKFRQAHTEQRRELTTLKEQLTDFDGTRKERDELKVRITEMEGELKGYKEIDSIVKLENSPGWKRDFVEPLNKAHAQLKELAGYGEIDPVALNAAIGLTGKAKFDALENLLSVVPAVLRGRIERVIDTIETKQSAMADERANAETAISDREKRAQQGQRDRHQQFQQTAKQAFDSTVKDIAAELGIKADAPEIATARKFFESNEDIAAAAKIIVRGHLLDATATEKKTLVAKVTELETELARYRKASPGLNGGSGDHSKSDLAASTSFIDGAKAALRGIR